MKALLRVIAGGTAVENCSGELRVEVAARSCESSESRETEETTREKWWAVCDSNARPIG